MLFIKIQLLNILRRSPTDLVILPSVSSGRDSSISVRSEQESVAERDGIGLWKNKNNFRFPSRSGIGPCIGVGVGQNTLRVFARTHRSRVPVKMKE